MTAGMPRCGTTLLASLLHQQPGVRFITDYVHWFTTASEQLGVSWTDRLTPAQRRVALATARDTWVRMGHVVLVGTDAFSTLDELHLAIARELAGEDDLVVGHKALLSVDQVDHLLRETDVHVLVMLRDPRAAALSYANRVGGAVEPYLWDLKRMARYCGRREDHPRLLTLRFEELIEEPAETLDRVCAWWNARAQLPEEVSFHRGTRDVPWSENSAFGDVRGRFDRKPLERWRQELDHPVVRYADHTCREVCERWGYEPIARGGWTPPKARATVHEAYWALERRAERWLRRTGRRLRERIAPPIGRRGHLP